MKYVVTGGAGFIGSNIVHHLVELGEDVTVIDNLSTGYKHNLKDIKKKIKFVNGDLRNLKLVNKTFKNQDFILHQAALPSVPRSIKDPIATNDNNVNTTLNVLVAAKDNNIQRVVCACSSSAYGNPGTPENHESFPLSPLTPYAVAKATGELYAQVFYKNYGLETVCLRYFNVFGPRQDPNSAYSAVIPIFIQKMLKNERPTIFGDGTITRDFTFVENNILANLKACTAKKAAGHVINIANNKTTSLTELVNIINKKLKKDIKPIYAPFRKGDIVHSLANIDKAKNLLKYKVAVDFEEGIEKTIEWYKKNG